MCMCTYFSGVGVNSKCRKWTGAEGEAESSILICERNVFEKILRDSDRTVL
jgi:hypothetical protein